jgi:DNA end-binding protein Ku
MAPRAISSATISFGLVSIPVKVYTAASSQSVSFNMLHEKCGGRIKQQLYCPKDDEVIERSDTVKGFEYAKNQYVIFTPPELKTMESERTNTLDIVEFVPLDSVDLIHVEKTYYLGPDKGGDKAYRLLAEAMRTSGKVAVGRWAAKGKEQLVLIRPYKDGLMLHQLYYANEVRAFDDVETGATFEFSELERDLAQKLISELSVKQFDATKYKDEFAVRVMAAVDQKVAGEQVHVAQEVPRAQIIDLFEALKQSLAQTQGGAQAQGGALAATGTESPKAREPSLDEVKPRPVEKAKPRKAAAKKKTG